MSTPSKTTAPSATRWRSRPAADSRPSPDATVASLRRGRQRSVATIPCVNRTPERHDSVTTDPRERRDSRIPVLMRDSGWSRPSAAAAIATHRSGKTAAGAPQIGICRSQRPIYGTAARIAADRSAQGLREAAVGRTASSGPSEATSPARRKPPVRPVGSHQSGPSEATSPARRKPPVLRAPARIPHDFCWRSCGGSRGHLVGGVGVLRAALVADRTTPGRLPVPRSPCSSEFLQHELSLQAHGGSGRRTAARRKAFHEGGHPPSHHSTPVAARKSTIRIPSMT
jgi:hypothetical protein